MPNSAIAIVDEGPVVYFPELLVFSFAAKLAIWQVVGVLSPQVLLLVKVSHTFEIKYLSELLVAFHHLLVRLLLHLSEIIIEHFLLVGIHDSFQKLITDADTFVLVVVLWHQVHLVVSHEFVEVPKIVLLRVRASILFLCSLLCRHHLFC